MKENIHPQYGKCIVRCVCGETFETGSTKKEMKVDICSKCHPFYTGKQKLVDTGGRVDRFKARAKKAAALKAQLGNKVAKAKKEAVKKAAKADK